MDYKELRQKFPVFVYEKFEVEKINQDLKIQYTFLVGPNIQFTPFIIIKNVDGIKPSDIENCAFNLGMVELLSYWKATYSPRIVIRSGYLDEYQVSWWNKLYVNGMGQYFFENNIDFKTDGFEIIVESDKKYKDIDSLNRESVLLAFSGGVDSTFNLELFTRNNISGGLFMLNPTVPTMAIANKYASFRQVVVERGIDPDLLSLNTKGYLNGHTPFSGYLAFLSILLAKVLNYKYCVFSNEYSSNESNNTFLGSEINHQYSKTFEFENDFRDYSKKYLSENINYFSFLRPLYNIQITKLFASLNENLSDVKSCNVNQKSGTWCLTCPKCLSTFILLYPFLTTDEIRNVFEGDIFEDRSLFPLLESLTDPTKIKPFECVGTREEIVVGLYLSIIKNKGIELPPLLQMAKDKILSQYANIEERTSLLMNSWNMENNLPNIYAELLRNKIQK